MYNKLTFILLFILIFASSSFSQNITPPVSSFAQVDQTIGFTNVHLKYSRPNMNGREVFGSLIPYELVWRAGANESSTVHFSTAVEINKTNVEAGTYSIYLIPSEKDWTFILNSDTTLWGARGFDSNKNVLEFALRPNRQHAIEETLFWGFEQVKNASANIVFRWSDIELSIPLEVPTDEITLEKIQAKLEQNPTAQDYYAAARYYLETGNDLEQALHWMEKRVELAGPQFGILRYKALIEKKLGKDIQAGETMHQSLQLAQEKGNDHYVRMNEKSLRDWFDEESELSGSEILKESIAYHDPESQWNSDTLSFQLYESRPGGGYRISDLSLNIKEEFFELKQRREKDLIIRKFSKEDGCVHMFNGQSNFTEAIKQKLGLDCERSEFYKNYYTYLWCLPMKLTDPGTIIDEQSHLVYFDDQKMLQVKVTYEGSVGGDIWYFYFNPTSFALSGYRFYHDESKNDGEYILIENEASFGKMRIPAKRRWYTHQGSRYLGSDEIIH